MLVLIRAKVCSENEDENLISVIIAYILKIVFDSFSIFVLIKF